jgi:hypothetical protein
MPALTDLELCLALGVVWCVLMGAALYTCRKVIKED